MSLCSAAVTNNANSKLLRIDMVSNDTSLSSPVRMELIGRIVDEYRAGTRGAAERIRAMQLVEDLT